MSTQRPDHLRPAGDPDDGAAMESFTVPTLPRRLSSRLFGRNPLIRASDRVEALTLVLAIAISLVAIPIGAAVGTASTSPVAACTPSRSRLAGR